MPEVTKWPAFGVYVGMQFVVSRLSFFREALVRGFPPRIGVRGMLLPEGRSGVGVRT